MKRFLFLWMVGAAFGQHLYPVPSNDKAVVELRRQMQKRNLHWKLTIVEGDEYCLKVWEGEEFYSGWHYVDCEETVSAARKGVITYYDKLGESGRNWELSDSENSLLPPAPK